MGIIHRGIPRDRALHFQARFGLFNFVETGTHVGHTAAWAAQHFRIVQTIEIDKFYFLQARRRCSAHRNVFLYNGDSATYLGSIIESLPSPALIWLDAHWSPDLRAGKPDIVCPIMYEVKQIAEDGRDHIVLIDDARLFGKNDWPAVEQIAAVFGPGWNLSIREDVIECVKSGR